MSSSFSFSSVHELIRIAQWLVEKLPNGRYRLTTLGAPTGIRDGLLWAYEHASTLDEKKVEEWELKPHIVPGINGLKNEVLYTYVPSSDSSQLGLTR
jgi:hypothetical protein